MRSVIPGIDVMSQLKVSAIDAFLRPTATKLSSPLLLIPLTHSHFPTQQLLFPPSSGNFKRNQYNSAFRTEIRSPNSGCELGQMKQRSDSQKFHHRWKRKSLVLLLLASCIATFVLMESHCSRIQMPPKTPKIAFLFIARNRIPLDIVWDAFFQGDADDKFSIFVHSRPGFVLTTKTTRSAFFLDRQINNSIQVDWGEASMIQAERVLIQNSLMDPLNERFVFLSDSCIPLYNFSYTYNYIMSASTSFVDSFSDTKEGRYNPKMHPVVPVHNWRKGSQWVVLTRKHAWIVVEDEIVFPTFQLHCKPAYANKEHNCIPDEHYVQTLLAQKGLEEEITRRSLTHSAWDLSSSKDPHRRGWHPTTYKLADANPTLIQSIKDVDNIYYETEYRREWCTSKGKPSKCFLFARKFTRPAALLLLNMSALGVGTKPTS